MPLTIPLTIKDIVTRLPSVRSNGQRRLKDIKYAVIHHSAVPSVVKYDHINRYVSEAKYHIKKGFNRFAYHLVIAQDGTVYQTNRFEEVTYHAGNFGINIVSLGICLDGDWSAHKPTTAQLVSLELVMDYLCEKRPDIPMLTRPNVRAHTEVRLGGGTTCPGRFLLNWVREYRR